MPKTLKEFILRKKQAQKEIRLAMIEAKEMGILLKQLEKKWLPDMTASLPTHKEAMKIREIAAMSSILLAKIKSAPNPRD